MTEFPRVEVSGDENSGWLAEIHDGTFHHVFMELVGNYEAVKAAAIEAFAKLHPESPMANPEPTAADATAEDATAEQHD